MTLNSIIRFIVAAFLLAAIVELIVRLIILKIKERE